MVHYNTDTLNKYAAVCLNHALVVQTVPPAINGHRQASEYEQNRQQNNHQLTGRKLTISSRAQRSKPCSQRIKNLLCHFCNKTKKTTNKQICHYGHDHTKDIKPQSFYIYIIKKNLKKEASQEVVPVFIISIITHFITLGMRVKHRLVEGQ